MSRVFYEHVKDVPKKFSEFKGHKSVTLNGVRYEKIALVFNKHAVIWRIGRLFKFLVYKIAGLYSKDYKKLSNRARRELKTGLEKVKSLYVRINVQNVQPAIDPLYEPKAFIPKQIDLPKLVGQIPGLPVELYDVTLNTMSTLELAKLATQLKITEKSDSDWLRAANKILLKRFKESDAHREEIFLALGLETLKKENSDFEIDNHLAARIFEVDGVQTKRILDLLEESGSLLTFFVVNFLKLSPKAKEKIIHHLNPSMFLIASPISHSHISHLLGLYAFCRAYGNHSAADSILEKIKPHLTYTYKWEIFFYFENMINELKKDEYIKDQFNEFKGFPNRLHLVKMDLDRALALVRYPRLQYVSAVKKAFEELFVEVMDQYLTRLKLTENPRLLLRLRDLDVWNSIARFCYEDDSLLELLKQKNLL